MTDKNLEKLNNEMRVDPQEYRWATFIRFRRPELKRHRIRSHVTAALVFRNDNHWGSNKKWYDDNSIRVYELEDGEWIDRTDNWVAEFMGKLEDKDRKEQEQRRLEALCRHPCVHCTVRGSRSKEANKAIAELARYKRMVSLLRGPGSDEWTDGIDRLTDLVVNEVPPEDALYSIEGVLDDLGIRQE